VIRRNVYSVLQTGHAPGITPCLSLAAAELIPARAWLGMNCRQQGSQVTDPCLKWPS
jgi:L-serine deaminase